MENTSTQGNPQPKVVIYTTPTCTYCHMAIDYFKANNIKYEEQDASDPKIGQALFERTGQLAVPVIDIGGRIVVGFDRGRIEGYLKA